MRSEKIGTSTREGVDRGRQRRLLDGAGHVLADHDREPSRSRFEEMELVAQGDVLVELIRTGQRQLPVAEDLGGHREARPLRLGEQDGAAVALDQVRLVVGNRGGAGREGARTNEDPAQPRAARPRDAADELAPVGQEVGRERQLGKDGELGAAAQH
jgi:hypothetical protein